jgi:ribosome-associated protein
MDKLNKEYIKLDQFLKMSNIISTGGEAKFYLMENEVLVNGVIENRRGRKLYPGDVVVVEGRKLFVG